MSDRSNNTPCPPGSDGREDVPVTENIVTVLLKSTHQVGDIIARQAGLFNSALVLLATALVCHGVFGVAIGFFGGWQVVAMDLVKVPLVAVCSLFICFPSLYVFTCVAGAPLTLVQTFMLGCSCLAMIGLLLVGLAPVVWLFAVSTDSPPFMVILTLLIWLIAVSFSARFVARLKSHALFKKRTGTRLWFFILMIVTLQMTTFMRPMLSAPDKGWRSPGKKFFLSHFSSTFEHKARTDLIKSSEHIKSRP